MFNVMCVLYNVSPAQADVLIITLPEMSLSLDTKSINEKIKKLDHEVIINEPFTHSWFLPLKGVSGQFFQNHF